MIPLDNWTAGTVAWPPRWHMPTLNNANFQMVCFCHLRQPARLLCPAPTISASPGAAACTHATSERSLIEDFGGVTAGTDWVFLPGSDDQQSLAN